MAKRTISQFKDFINTAERLSHFGCDNQNPEKIPATKYRTRKENQSAFRRYFQTQELSLV